MIADRSGPVRVSAPGRICLFGEHQDYLQLPVIPCAISLRVLLEGAPRKDSTVQIALPDIQSKVSFSLHQTFPYVLERDYFRAAVNVLRRYGCTFSHGFECLVRGMIPIRAGTSSSTALVMAWINFLARMSDQNLSLSVDESLHLAFEAEVMEFNEPGGMMDQCSIAYGGVLFVRFFPTLTIEQLRPDLRTFVLGDSGEMKETRSVLARVKNRVLGMCDSISRSYPKFSLQDTSVEESERYKTMLTPEEYSLLQNTLRNRDLTREGRTLLSREKLDEHGFGRLLTEQQQILRDVLCVSTPKIDRMIEAGLNAGAYGGKINGSGGGGCMFVYAPEQPETAAQAIERAGGKASIVHLDAGIRFE